MPDETHPDLAKFQADQMRLEGQLRSTNAELLTRIGELHVRLTEAEVSLKKYESQPKTEEGKARRMIGSPLTIAIITGILSLIAAAVASLLQTNSSLKLEQKKFEFAAQQEKLKNDATIDLERQKFESTLVLKAIETGDPASAARNLQFLIDARYLSDTGGEIAKYVKEPDARKGPVLPRPGTSILTQNIPSPAVRVVTTKDRFGNTVSFQKTDDGLIKYAGDWEKQNIIDVSIPQLKAIKGYTGTGNVRFNRNAAAALKSAFAELEGLGLLDRIESWNGAYAPRVVRGTNIRSAHAEGVAFDINVASNPLGRTPPAPGEKGSVRELVPIFEKHGFVWGGNFTRPEGNHFEYKPG